MIIHKIQRQIESIYHFSSEYDAEKFLMTLAENRFGQIRVGNHLGKEALLVRQCENEMEIGLFLENSILEDLESHDPYRFLGEHNLASFCMAVEGVSHFLYLVQHVERGTPVTRLELELQAEIDKYLSATLLFFQHSGEIPSFLFRHLFEMCSWDESLNETEKSRYKEANWLATKFCAHLEQHYICHKQWRTALEQARHFYHLNHWEKMRHLTP